RPPQAQAERLDAGLKPLEKPGLEDADKGDLAPLFPLMILIILDRFYLLVRLALVRGECQALDGCDDLVVEPAVGRAKAIGDAVELPLREDDGFPLDRGVRVGGLDIRPGVPHHDLFEKVEQDDPCRRTLLIDLFSGSLEVGIQVADSRLPEVVRLALREQTDLASQVENVVVDRSCGQQDDLLPVAVTSPTAIELDDRIESEVAVRLLVAEVVALVDQDHVKVGVGLGVEVRPAKLLAAKNRRRNRGRLEFLRPHGSQRRRADDERLLAAMVSEVLKQFLADPGLPKSHGVGDQHSVVSEEDAAGLLHRVLLELGEIDGAPAELRGVHPELLLEVLVKGLDVDLIGRVLLTSKLAGVEKVDQVVLEVDRLRPPGLIPGHEVGDGSGTYLTLDKAPGVVRDFDAGRIDDRLPLPVIAQVAYPSSGIGITGVVSRAEDPVD